MSSAASKLIDLSRRFRKTGMLVLIGAALVFSARPGAAELQQSASLVEYQPTPDEFPPQVTPVVRLMLEGSGAGSVDVRRRKFTEGLKAAATLRKKLGRGYFDELDLLAGFAYEKLGNTNEALRAYASSLQERGDNPIALFRHALLEKQQHGCERAIAQLKEVLWRTRRAEHEVLALLGECLLELGRKDEALPYIEKAHERNPNYVPVLRRLVETRLEILGNTVLPEQRTAIERRILQDLQSITAQEPDDRDAAIQLTRYLLKFSDPLLDKESLNQAEQLAQRFAERSSFSDDTAVRLLIDTQIRKHDFTSAAQTLQLGLKKQPKSPLLEEAKRQLEIEQATQG